MGMINHQKSLTQNANTEVMLALHEIGVGSINQALTPQNEPPPRDVKQQVSSKPNLAHDSYAPPSNATASHNGASVLEYSNTFNMFPSVTVSDTDVGLVASVNTAISKEASLQVNSGPQRNEDEYKTQLSAALTSRKEGACRHGRLRVGRWTSDEKVLFLYGLRKFGKGRWKKISLYVPGRSLVQIKSHAQKVLKRIDSGENVFRRLDENGARLQILVSEIHQTFGLGPVSNVLNVQSNSPAHNIPTSGSNLHNFTIHPNQQNSREWKQLESSTAEEEEGSTVEGSEHILAASALCQLSLPSQNFKSFI